MADRLSVLKTILWALVGVLAAVTVVRFAHGLGAVTNLSDATPWGLWVAFDVMAGVALAAGGFVLAASVYIFGLERYRVFVRPAILTALLGYVAVAVGLLYDLGLPWHIWYPAIHPQHHSVLFEVAACVMLYLTVLALEFAPVVLEHRVFDRPLFQRIVVALKRYTIPLVIAGIVLSTLHQSSLGSLFLITPYRLHPLWYSPIIYLLFFVSAVGLGLMTVVLESLVAGYFLRHRVPTRLLSGLALAAAAVLALYAVLRVGDLAVRGALGLVVDGSSQSYLFFAELAVSAVVPAALLLSRKVRGSVAGLAVCTSLTVSGLVWNRLNVCIVAFARPDGAAYFPSWMEITVTLGIIAGGVLAFLFFVERFRVYGDEEVAPAPAKPTYHPALANRLMPSSLAAPRRYSLVAAVAAAAAIPFLPVRGPEPVSTPVRPPSSLDGLSIARDDGSGRVLAPASPALAVSSDVESLRLLVIDGNRDDMVVLFDHDGHSEREGADASCALCHHLNMPFDRSSSCSECHRDMYEPTPLFDHGMHVIKLEGREGCSECHSEGVSVKDYETATACAECHEYGGAPDPIVDAPQDRWRDAASYLDAMHNLCIRCHERNVAATPERYTTELRECANCHDADRRSDLTFLAPRKVTGATAPGGG